MRNCIFHYRLVKIGREERDELWKVQVEQFTEKLAGLVELGKKNKTFWSMHRLIHILRI